MSQTQLKVTYFDFPGRGEFTRLLLVAGGIAFEDERIALDDLAALKPSLPLGQVPTLTVDGVVYSQSRAMAAYAARLAGLLPTDPLDALKADMIIETLTEVSNAAIEIVFFTPEEQAKADKSSMLLNETVPKSFAVVQNLLQGKFQTGESMTWADICIFNVVHNFLLTSFPELKLSDYPQIEAVVAGVKENDGIAAYLAKHP